MALRRCGSRAISSTLPVVTPCSRVDRNLAVPGLPNVFVIGDAAGSDAWRGKPVPGLAPAAKQGGTHTAKLITARVLGRADPGPFIYRHYGSLATIPTGISPLPRARPLSIGQETAGQAPLRWRAVVL
jgi:hypothetical protein